MRTMLAVLALSALLAACSSARTAELNSPVSPTTTDAPQDMELTAAAHKARSVLETQYPQQFAGLALDHEHRQLTIYRIPADGLDAALQNEIKGITLVFKDAKMALLDARKLTERVTQDMPYWRAHGVEISSVGPRSDGTGVDIMVAKLNAETEQKLVDRYGREAIHISEGTIVPIPGTERYNPTSSK